MLSPPRSTLYRLNMVEPVHSYRAADRHFRNSSTPKGQDNYSPESINFMRRTRVPLRIARVRAAGTDADVKPRFEAENRTQAKPEAKADKDKVGPTAGTEDEQALTRMEREVTAALVKADTAALEQLWAEEFTLTNPGGNVTKKADYIAL